MRRLTKGMVSKFRSMRQLLLHGYDQLVVLGLKLSADEKDSKQFLEDLLETIVIRSKG
jgi:hypothetical protein